LQEKAKAECFGFFKDFLQIFLDIGGETIGKA
jgi:hypothetical protein